MTWCKKHTGLRTSPVDPCHYCTEELAKELLNMLNKCHCGEFGIWEICNVDHSQFLCNEHIGSIKEKIFAPWAEAAIKLNDHFELA